MTSQTEEAAMWRWVVLVTLLSIMSIAIGFRFQRMEKKEDKIMKALGIDNPEELKDK